MRGNRVHETSTTTGTGNLTLAGAITGGYQTFNNKYGTDVRFFYFIDNEDALWETGIGYLSASTTLVRETVHDNSSGTQAAISFTGTLQVYVTDTAQSLAPAMDTVRDDGTLGRMVQSAHSFDESAQVLENADRVFYVPFELKVGGQFDALSITLTGLLGTKMRIGLYHMVDGLPGDLIVESADIDTSSGTGSTGQKTETFTAIDLSPGWYCTAIVADAKVTISSIISTNHGFTPFGVYVNGSNINGVYYLMETHASWSALPASAGTILTIDNWRPIPQIWLRKA